MHTDGAARRKNSQPSGTCDGSYMSGSTAADTTPQVSITDDREQSNGPSDSSHGPVNSVTLVAPSSRVSPEPSQTDLQGHYVGPASGVSFLLRVQKQLHQIVSFTQTASIFTFGDAPLPEHDPSFCVLLSRDEAQRLLERYFDFAVPTHRFLHRPTVQSWLNEFYDTMGMMSHRDDAPPRIAVLFMVFAQAHQYMHSNSSDDSDMR